MQRRTFLKAAEEVAPELVAPQGRSGALYDHYSKYHLPDPPKGLHTATATVRRIDTGEESRHRIEFEVG